MTEYQKLVFVKDPSPEQVAAHAAALQRAASGQDAITDQYPEVNALLRKHFNPDVLPGVFLDHILLPLQYDFEDLLDREATAAYNRGREAGPEDY